METEEYYGGTYPDPPEKKEKNIKVRVCVSYSLNYDVPKDWSTEQIEDDIKENFNDFFWEDLEIENIEVE